jgi:nucleoside-diphosphate-sugar epimerase
MIDGSHLFFFGFGYCAARIAALLRQEGVQVAMSGTTRSEEKLQLGASAVQLRRFDGQQPMEQAEQALAQVTHLLVSVPPGAEGDPALRLHREALRAAPRLRWVGYLSSTQVYGDTAGEWVDERTVPTSSSPRLTAEGQWLEFGRERSVPVHILRLGGIYGPGAGRNAMAMLQAGTARRVVRPGLVFNRVHVDDIAATVRAAARARGESGVYNVVDDRPLPPQDVIVAAARLLGQPPPPEVSFDDPSLPPFVSAMYSGYHRVKNDKIKDELGVMLRYPDILQGLAALHAQGR